MKKPLAGYSVHIALLLFLYFIFQPGCIEQLLANQHLPDGQRAELIDGVIYDMASPSRIHQKLVSELHTAIVNYIRAKGGSCEVYPAPFAVFLTADDKTYVEPDISVICDKNKLSDRGCEGAPGLVVEIISPSTRVLPNIITRNTRPQW